MPNPNTQFPRLYRKVFAGDRDSNNQPVLCGNTYLEESLESSATGSILQAGGLERLTLYEATQPMQKGLSSSEGFSEIIMDDGSKYRVLKRAAEDVLCEVWQIVLVNVQWDRAYVINQFKKKVGKTHLVRMDDPDGNIIIGYVSEWSESKGRLYSSYSIQVEQQPGVTSL